MFWYHSINIIRTIPPFQIIEIEDIYISCFPFRSNKCDYIIQKVELFTCASSHNHNHKITCTKSQGKFCISIKLNTIEEKVAVFWILHFVHWISRTCLFKRIKSLQCYELTGVQPSPFKYGLQH